MPAKAIGLQRLYQQRLSANPLATPEEIVTWLGAVQAQEYAGGKWALGLRMQKPLEEAIEQAFNQGSILRTHIMRPTWHFVTAADIRWIQELTAPRVNALNAYMNRKFELDDALFLRTNLILTKALEGGQTLTKAELGVALAQAGIMAEGVRLGLIVMRAELDALICSGPRRGKQFTYALLEERAPYARILKRDEALFELTLRYFTGHGPATIQDFVWWSGLSVADAKTGLGLVGSSQLASEVVEGQTYWFSTSMPAASEQSITAFLLATYDEFLVGFASFATALRGGRKPIENEVFQSALVVEGQVVGNWRRSFKKGAAVIDLVLFDPLSDTENEAIMKAIQRYSEFIGMPVIYTVPKEISKAGLNRQ